MPGNGWIKLYRKTQSSNMYRNLNSKQRDVMINCLLLANHEGNEWEWNGGIYQCKPGQFITSLNSLKEVCAKDVTIQNIRTALKKLKRWGFLTSESTKTGRLITIVNWENYQSKENETNKVSNKELTKSQQSTNKELTTNKNVKNEKNDKEDIYPYQKIADLYNQICKSLPSIRTLSDNRKGHIRARWNEEGSIEVFEKLFQKAENSSFLKGNNDRNWTASFDWLLKNNNNFNKVLEGKYDDKDTFQSVKKSNRDKILEQQRKFVERG